MYAIAVNTFREAVRDKVLFGILAFSTGLLFFTLALAELSLNQEERVVSDVGLASVSLASILVAVVLGSSLLYKEIERKTLYVILPKPIYRVEFLVGKYFGIVLTIFVFLALQGAIHFLVRAKQAGAAWVVIAAVVAGCGGVGAVTGWRARDKTSVLLPWSAVCLVVCAYLAARMGVRIDVTMYSLVLFFGEVFLVSSVAILFSSFSTPFLTGMFTLGVWLLGRTADTMATLKTNVLGDALKQVLRGLAYVLPNMYLFVPGQRALLRAEQTTGGMAWYVTQSMGYAALYSAILLCVAALLFRRRDFI
jgi:Cu-processing system permease protein